MENTSCTIPNASLVAEKLVTLEIMVIMLVTFLPLK